MGDVPRELLAGGVANATASILLNWYEMNSHSRHLRDIQILKRVFERSTERLRQHIFESHYLRATNTGVTS